MKYSIKVALGLVAIATLAGVYYGDNYMTTKKDERQKETTYAIFFDTKDVVKFTVQNKNAVFTFIRDSLTSPWKLISPIAVAADQDAVNNILAAIQQLTVQQELLNTEAALKGDKAMLSEFGLENTKNSVTIDLKNSEIKQLFIGSDLDLGKKSVGGFNPASVYAMNPTKKLLLVIDNSFISVLENKTLSDFRSKRIGDFKGTDVVSLDIKSHEGNIVVSKDKNSKWEVQKPHAWPADPAFLEEFLGRYQGLLGQKIYENQNVTPDLKKKFNLLPPSAVVDLKDSSGKTLQNFEYGITKDGIFVTMRDGAVAQLNLDLWSDLIPKDKYFLNRQVLLGINLDHISGLKLSHSTYLRKDNNWYFVESETQQPSVSQPPNAEVLTFFSNWELMTADDLILNATNEDLVHFGLTKPLKTFSFLFKPNSNTKSIEIIVGNRVPKNEKSVYLKRSDAPTVYIVEAGWLSLLAQLYSVGDTSHTSVKK
ncbi:DUF4340 domain-containing protein [Fluviispira multicolorata]|uniref:DUF4340 domain-containing protein n=1 Tax=Fluviispira multicolorata TaxID=2654512 RepID=A0A833JAM3_9BACT|nr:DUF4340 domain-containing protein [Fluviispira multicolorata]KAB8028066.1 DUF4340 domain-containing protein [Fluviispira multicolorata]